MRTERNRTERWTLRLGGVSYEIQVAYKQMRSIRLRVLPGGELRLSAPIGIEPERLRDFIEQRAGWIAANTERMKAQRLEPQGRPAPLTEKERRDALRCLMPLVEKWYPAVEPYGVVMPHVTVRAMTTRYGTCSVGRARITLNAMLVQAPAECAEYVVLHELTHFLYPNHGRQFYAFIESHMPDWRERERRLRAGERRAQAGQQT